jgi:hypothetical protein
MQNKLVKVEKQIRSIKQKLMQIDEMRPGVLTIQYHTIPTNTKKYPFYQISYTLNMKSHSNYIRKKFVRDVEKQIRNYKIFKMLTKRWVNLSIRHAKLKLDIALDKS